MKRWLKVRPGEVVQHRTQFTTIDDLTNYEGPRVQLRVQGVALHYEAPGAIMNAKTHAETAAGLDVLLPAILVRVFKAEP